MLSNPNLVLYYLHERDLMKIISVFRPFSQSDASMAGNFLGFSRGVHLDILIFLDMAWSENLGEKKLVILMYDPRYRIVSSIFVFQKF